MLILFKFYVPCTLGLHKLQMQQKMNLGQEFQNTNH